MQKAREKCGAELVRMRIFDFGALRDALDDFVDMGVAFAANCWKDPSSGPRQEI